MMQARLLAIAFLATLATAQVVRQAFVTKFSGTNPVLAGALWPGHPDVLFKVDLDRIAMAAVAGKPIPRDRIDHIMAASQWAPLAVDPFLVRGVAAHLARDEVTAELAFVAAKRRDPRSIAARYFLADQYLRTSQSAKGLVELGALTRMVPGSIEKLAPYYASYARQPGGEAQLKKMLGNYPDMQATVLGVLAADANNADLILRLRNDGGGGAGRTPSWASRLTESLLDAGEFAKARAVWAKVANVSADAFAERPIFDAEFRGSPLPPPFNWTLSSSGSGIAEASGHGRLHIIYFGRDNIILASQTLLLKPGNYRLAFNVAEGVNASTLAWTMTCRPSGSKLASFSLGRGAPARQVKGVFEIGSDCPAQRLELVGVAPEFPETVDVTISGLDISKVPQ
jgi:hypothetical protein